MLEFIALWLTVGIAAYFFFFLAKYGDTDITLRPPFLKYLKREILKDKPLMLTILGGPLSMVIVVIFIIVIATDDF
jgi:hypothetical protein